MPDKLNVCLLNDSFPPVIDGVANTVVNYAEIINKNYGHSMVATPSYPNVTDNYDYPVFRYPSVNTTKLIGYRTGMPFQPSAIGGLEKEKIDIIHSHCPVVSTILARTLRQTTNAPIVLTYHTKFDVDLENAVSSNLVQKAALKFLATSINACDEVWAVSHGAGENMRKIGYMGDYIVMENGVDFQKGRAPQEKIDEISKLHGLRSDVPVFMFVGRMMWYKGIKISLDGLKIAKDSGAVFRMIFVGDGADRADIEQYAERTGLSEECIFTGAIHDRELLRAYFSRGDMFLFPSTYDTNGIVVREAAACGLGTVMIRNSCAAEGINDGENGILVDENAKAMSEAIIAACKNTVKMKQIGQHAMDEIYLSWEDSVARAVDRYHVILERRKSGIIVPKDTFSDDLYRFMGEICEGIDKVQGKRITGQEKLKANIVKTKTKFKDQKFRVIQKKTKVRKKLTDFKNKHL